MTATTIGALGGDWRADVTASGAVVPWDGSPTLDWAIAADDRWHRPVEEVAVRQLRLAGTPVVETRVKIPGGDAVQRVWAVADRGGATLVEVTNDSPLPIAVAFTRADLLTARAPTDVPIDGIDLPAGSVVLPIGHRASVMVALAHDGRRDGQLPDGWSSAEAVVRGWQVMTEQASRLELPDERLAHAVTAARSDVLLTGADRDDPVARLLALHELSRLGQLPADDVALEVAGAAEAVLRDAPAGWATDAALDGAAHVLHTLGERRAVTDLRRMIDRRPAAPAPDPATELPGGIADVAAVERRLLARGELFPGGIPPTWRGQPVEAHGLVAGPSSTLSFGVRWHGEHPAVLWDVSGEPVDLRASALDARWSSSAPNGEALWRLADAPAFPVGESAPSFS